MTIGTTFFHAILFDLLEISEFLDLEKKKDAYFEIVESRIDRYGEAKIKSESGRSYIDGVCYVNLIDFNNDENEELFIAYRKQVRQSATDYYTGNFIVVEEPTYCMEVYSWNGTVAKKIFSWIVFLVYGLAIMVGVSGNINGGAQIFTNWFGMPLWTAQLIYYAMAGIVVFMGMKAVGIAQKYAVVLLMAL